MIRLAKYTKPYQLKILLAVLLLFAQAYFDLALPAYLSRLVSAQVLAGGLEDAISTILRDGGVMLALSLGSMVCAVAEVFISAQVAAGIGRHHLGRIDAEKPFDRSVVIFLWKALLRDLAAELGCVVAAAIPALDRGGFSGPPAD